MVNGSTDAMDGRESAAAVIDGEADTATSPLAEIHAGDARAIEQGLNLLRRCWGGHFDRRLNLLMLAGRDVLECEAA